MENGIKLPDTLVVVDRRGSSALVVTTSVLIYLAYTIGKIKGQDFATRFTKVK